MSKNWVITGSLAVLSLGLIGSGVAVANDSGERDDLSGKDAVTITQETMSAMSMQSTPSSASSQSALSTPSPVSAPSPVSVQTPVRGVTVTPQPRVKAPEPVVVQPKVKIQSVSAPSVDSVDSAPSAGS